MRQLVLAALLGVVLPTPVATAEAPPLLGFTPDAAAEQRALERRFRSSWGQEYDGEQMLEHAICHPARHVRQIRRFLDGELV